MFQSWKVYDAGPKSVRCPLIFLPPACGTAEIYFRQILHLSACGYRVIGVHVTRVTSVNICKIQFINTVYLNLQVEAPGSYWNVNDWCIGFQLLLDHLRLDKVHLFGASLGKLLPRLYYYLLD